ncbi:phosphatidylinositol-glycan biosynthesis class S protein [Mrakia frigida]|uniref:GPI-anchor transamidase GPI17 n=1 Tax=Mrakia frigida TaxID=29902 RepID=UPI003FCC0C33
MSPILLSFWTIILFSLPFWWISTSIERLPLRSLSDQSRTSLETLRFSETVLLSVQGDPSWLDEARLVQEVRRELEKVDGRGREEIWLTTSREGVRGDNGSSTTSSSTTPWEIVLQPSTSSSSSASFSDAPPPPLLGSIGDSTLYVQICPENYASLPSYLSRTLSHLFPTSSQEDPRTAKFSDHYTLAFTLLLEDVTEPGGGGGNPTGWEIEKGLKATIQPLLDALSPLHTFTLESQIQYHSPLSITPVERFLPAIKTDTGEEGTPAALTSTWVVEKEDTKAFVNSEQWSLGSQGVVDDGPTLQFMMFVPRGGRRPLRFEGEGDKTSTSFLIPQQGSLVLLNPAPSPSSSSSSTLSPSLLHPPLLSHLRHLRRLLGLPSPSIFLPPNTTFAQSQSNPLSLTRWELSWLARARTLQNVRDSVEGVRGLERLVSKIGEMRVGKGVRDDVFGAVGELEEIVNSSPSSPFSIFPRSSKALALSSRAFFNPTMLGLLYFPDEHKYAVYTPLFAPVGVPLIVALVKAVKKRRKDRADALKKEKEGTKTVVQEEEKKEDGASNEVGGSI